MKLTEAIGSSRNVCIGVFFWFSLKIDSPPPNAKKLTIILLGISLSSL